MTRSFARLMLPLAIFAASSCDCGLEPLEQVPDPPPPPVVEPLQPTGAVEGRVCSGDGETWLEAARIYIELPDAAPIETASDVDGHFRLENIPAASWTVHIEKGSFSTTRDVVVESGLTVIIPEDECQLDHAPRIAVVHGSQYDRVEGVLAEIGVEAETLNIYQADWAEQLLEDDNGLDDYDILLLNCRSNEDTYKSRPDMQARLRAFVDRGGSLYASDQAYDLIELTFPDKVNFLGDDDIRGDGDQGDSVDLDVTVLDPVLANSLGHNHINIHFGLSTWSVMIDAADDVEVYMHGDAPLLDGSTIDNAPMIIGFDHGEGRVVYSSFHQEPGIGADQEQVLKLIMFEL